jgi:hypothetical protein
MPSEHEKSVSHRSYSDQRRRGDTPYRKKRENSQESNSRDSDRSRSELSNDENPQYMMKQFLKKSLK